MGEQTRELWPALNEPGVQSDPRRAAEPGSESEGGALGGLRASVPVMGSALAPAAGAAIVTVCLSCIGVAGAAAFGAALGSVVAWATPFGYALGGLLTVLFVRRELRRRRASCSPSQYRKIRLVILAVAIALAGASYALSALFVLPLVRQALPSGGGDGSGLLP